MAWLGDSESGVSREVVAEASAGAASSEGSPGTGGPTTKMADPHSCRGEAPVLRHVDGFPPERVVWEKTRKTQRSPSRPGFMSPTPSRPPVLFIRSKGGVRPTQGEEGELLSGWRHLKEFADVLEIHRSKLQGRQHLRASFGLDSVTSCGVEPSVSGPHPVRRWPAPLGCLYPGRSPTTVLPAHPGPVGSCGDHTVSHTPIVVSCLEAVRRFQMSLTLHEVSGSRL